jgi:ketosteroid isomerase-like protein
MLGLFLTFALTALQTSPATSVAQAVAAVDAQFDEALANRSRPALEELLAHPFLWIHALEGRIDDRETFLTQSTRGMGLARQHEETTTFDSRLDVHGTTAISTARLRVRFGDGLREVWWRQTRVYVLEGEAWKLASGQGTRMYDGPPTIAGLYARYAGTYAIDASRTLKLEWDGNSLLGTLPSGAQMQVFLKSATEEAASGPDHFTFTLDPSGTPIAATLMRGEERLWRAERTR